MTTRHPRATPQKSSICVCQERPPTTRKDDHPNRGDQVLRGVGSLLQDDSRGWRRSLVHRQDDPRPPVHLPARPRNWLPRNLPAPPQVRFALAPPPLPLPACCHWNAGNCGVDCHLVCRGLRVLGVRARRDLHRARADGCLPDSHRIRPADHHDPVLQLPRLREALPRRPAHRLPVLHDDVPPALPRALRVRLGACRLHGAAYAHPLRGSRVLRLHPDRRLH
mmetsp:Transcript_21454/g.63313  ORF Transcript_21454/g.63313 Transcript_21454/m.63313 type:complete len:222 (-) Transcript_21454:1145-1810(-)